MKSGYPFLAEQVERGGHDKRTRAAMDHTIIRSILQTRPELVAREREKIVRVARTCSVRDAVHHESKRRNSRYTFAVTAVVVDFRSAKARSFAERKATIPDCARSREFGHTVFHTSPKRERGKLVFRPSLALRAGVRPCAIRAICRC
jgi:hypothetical protein